MRSQRKRRAVTLVEFVVVIAILGTVSGVGLSAVQAARMRAARTQAANVMRQLMQATHAYADQHKGQLLDYTNRPPQSGGSIIRELRPHLGAAPVQPLPYLRLPSDPSGKPNVSMFGPTPDGGSVLVEPCSFGFSGVSYAAGVRLDRSFTDGLGNTVGVAEHYGVCRKTAFDIHVQGGALTIDKDGSRYTTNTRPRFRRTTFADYPMYDDVHPVTTTQDDRPVTRGSKPQTFQQQPTPAGCDYRVPQSSLPGGLSVGFLDGSVRVLNPNTSPEVFWGAVTPAGGEVLNFD